MGRRFFIINNKPVKSSQLVFEKKRCLPFLSQDGVWCTDGEGTQSYQGPKGVRGERAGATVASRDPTERTCAMAAAIGPPKVPKSTHDHPPPGFGLEPRGESDHESGGRLCVLGVENLWDMPVGVSWVACCAVVGAVGFLTALPL